MNPEAPPANPDRDQLIEHARALLAATTGLAEEKIVEARKRLAAVLEDGKGMFCRARERAAESVRAANATVHEHPYKAVIIAAGVGLLSGLLLNRRGGCKCD